MKKALISTLLLGILFSCSKQNTPENALRDYINYRFQDNQTREKLLDITTGELNFSLQQMDDEQFENFVAMERYKKGKLEISLQKCTDSTCFITYVLKYNVVNPGEKPPKDKEIDAEVKKIAKLEVDENGTWKMSDVKNIKTYFDAKIPIDISAEN